MRTSRLLIMCLAIFLVGCRDSNYGEADDKFLCDPETGDAFYVTPHIGQTSVVKKIPQANPVCEKTYPLTAEGE